MKCSFKLIITAGLLITFCHAYPLTAQQIKIPANITSIHPRLLIHHAEKERFRTAVSSQPWAAAMMEQLRKKIDPYVARHQQDTAWIISRLQMYWQHHYTDVFIRGGAYAYATGYAPVPTVRFTGTRDVTTPYRKPRLEEIKPYMDSRGLYLQNGKDSTWEWVEQSRTGRIVEAINREIMGLAQQAAFLYWLTGEERYARFAFDLFDTYMTGMYYRKEPVDLNHGHAQTLVGLSSFEVIHEDILNELTPCYDFLYSYLQTHAAAKMDLYAATFKQWADIIIKNGVPFNNWDLIQARFVATIAAVLENDQVYKDGHGCQYYLNKVLNETSIRQWAVTELIRKGYDPQTAIWNECPGYSLGVISDFIGLATLLDNVLNLDLIQQLPILPKAMLATAQYLYPNGYTVGFGDTHYGRLPTTPVRQLVQHAQQHHLPEQEKLFTGMLKMLMQEEDKGQSISRSFNDLFTPSFSLQENIPAASLQDFVTPAFYAPNVSYFVQRSGGGANNGLMISQAGAAGNHAHSNGIAMELYGKGLPLAPEGGIGTSYFQADYAEYYSQFPAHNTVVVDGISSYPTMRSNHPFSLNSCYPASRADSGYFPGITYSDLSFLEPETNADQRRQMGIIRVNDSSGYYVDIFRSRKKEGQDKRHDYFYHNLGQTLTVTDAAGKPLPLQPTTTLSFAEGDLMAYDYLWNKRSALYEKDFNAHFQLRLSAGNEVQMHMWMKGTPGREVFAVQSPPSRAFGRGWVTDSIANLPVPAIVVRQTGEAWNRPFVAVYEPATQQTPGTVQSIAAFTPLQADSAFAGVWVQHHSGRQDYIFSNAGNREVAYSNMTVQGAYAVISTDKAMLQSLFLGNGRKISREGYGIYAQNNTAAALQQRADGWYFTAAGPVSLTWPDNGSSEKIMLTAISNNKQLRFTGKKATIANKQVWRFELPAMPFTKITIAQGAYDLSAITDTVQQWINRGYYPGAGLKIVKDSQVIYEHYFGNYQPQTVAYVASSGKWLAAAAIAAVVEEGKLSWDDPVVKWLPAFKDIKGKATLRQLLSHTAGYPDYQPPGKEPDHYQTLKASVAHIVDLPADTLPGSKFRYGGLAMQVAGRMAELATGKDWETIFQQKIARPLGMRNTHFTPVDTTGGHNPMIGGGVRTTLNDYTQFLEMMMGNGMYKGRRILSEKAIQEMMANQVRTARVNPGEFVERARGRLHKSIYGLGLWREELDGQQQATLISSPGWAGAYPWLDKKNGVYGFMITHVNVEKANRDHFSSFYASPVLPMMVRDALKK